MSGRVGGSVVGQSLLLVRGVGRTRQGRHALGSFFDFLLLPLDLKWHFLQNTGRYGIIRLRLTRTKTKCSGTGSLSC